MAEYMNQFTNMLDNLPLDTYTLFLICNVVLIAILVALLWKEGLAKVLVFVVISLGLTYGIQYLTFLELWKSCVLVCILEILLEICIRGLKGSGAKKQRPATASGIVSYPIAVGGGSAPNNKSPQGQNVAKGGKKSYKRPENKTFSLWSKKQKEQPAVQREDLDTKKQALKAGSTRQEPEPIRPLFDISMQEKHTDQMVANESEIKNTEFSFQTKQNNDTMEIPDLMLSKSDENETEEERIRRLLEVLAEHDKERAVLEFENSFGNLSSDETDISVNLDIEKYPSNDSSPQKIENQKPKVDGTLFEALLQETSNEADKVEEQNHSQWHVDETPVEAIAVKTPVVEAEENPILTDEIVEKLFAQDFFIEDQPEDIEIKPEIKEESTEEEPVDNILQVAFDETGFYTEDEITDEAIEGFIPETAETQQEIFSNIKPINLDKDLEDNSELTYEWELEPFNFDEKDMVDLSPKTSEEVDLTEGLFEDSVENEWMELPNQKLEPEPIQAPVAAQTKESSILWTDTIVMDDLIKEQQNIMLENEAAIINLLQGDYNDAPKIETLHSVVILMNRAATENLMKSAHELLESDVAGGANLLKQVCLCATDSELSNRAFFELMEAMPDLSLKEQEDIVDRMIAKEEMLINLMHKKNINVSRNEMEWF